jgi:hypothetical protein
MDGNTIVLAGKLEEAFMLPAHLSRELARILDPLMPLESTRKELFGFLEGWTCSNQAERLNQAVKEARFTHFPEEKN